MGSADCDCISSRRKRYVGKLFEVSAAASETGIIKPVRASTAAPDVRLNLRPFNGLCVTLHDGILHIVFAVLGDNIWGRVRRAAKRNERLTASAENPVEYHSASPHRLNYKCFRYPLPPAARLICCVIKR